jgi:pimeloyl-ACP methyl ester carboxylesterase
VLHRAGGSAVPWSEPPPWPPAASRPRLFFVAGLFAECLDRWVPAFKDVIEDLVAAGFEATVLTVAGRGTAAANGDVIAAAMRALPADGRGAIVFGYSKGAVDVLEALVRHPEAMRPVGAVVTIAGAQNGSHLAESRGDVYGALVAGLPMAGCERGTGEEIAELRRDVRQAWWARHGRSIKVPIYSLVALPAPDRLSPFLTAGARELAQKDPRNDGNIVWRDAIAPGSTLLGLVDADHWTIALPLARELPLLAPLLSDDVPRSILFSAAVTIAMSNPAGRR